MHKEDCAEIAIWLVLVAILLGRVRVNFSRR
jgi:hypothetical protein